ncbi:DUF167 family protein [Afifella marina]|uniref:UPF0235 protein SAMN03080610_02463 n=1 Tax=Afifella marina DSM 2698 TaxID=1120955 RepID=A0A1G5NQ68_AFIMA|nr:DUF167 family protein [Afifella marina]MBK1624682.1 hypothetical protein [Afifella marina DSM 2698]MBK1627381.1 hypothetical protein [Afifella marina]MBK5915853.1 hypothetical protein [Afifella marina]RAI20603.1 hypothetical protein CH311_09430 [Afifella marina DSM 2698]SCZ39533.1 hypothetical protein SAMN03080610_02463 [Afifella marina DSM 2698]
MSDPFRATSEGLLLSVRLTPKAAKDALEGVEELADGRAVIKARVRAVPEKGAANKALENLVAKALGVPKSSVSVASGGTSRVKVLLLAGDADALKKKLQSVV